MGSDGTLHNLGYIDADDGFVATPVDPRLTTIESIPSGIFRPHIVSRFDEVGLDPKVSVSTFSGGSYSISKSNLVLQTGTTLGGGCEMAMPNVRFTFVPGSMLYFYLLTEPNGNLDIQFGAKSADGADRLCFHRVEDNVAGLYNAETSHASVQSSTATDMGGNSVRRFFLIRYVTDAVKFYIGNDGGKLSLRSTITDNLPTGDGTPFLRFVNRYAANRKLSIDDIYVMPIK